MNPNERYVITEWLRGHYGRPHRTESALTNLRTSGRIETYSDSHQTIQHIHMDGATNTMAAVFSANVVESSKKAGTYDLVVLFGSCGLLPSGNFRVGDAVVVEEAVYAEWGNGVVGTAGKSSYPRYESKRREIVSYEFARARALKNLDSSVPLARVLCTDKVIKYSPKSFAGLGSGPETIEGLANTKKFDVVDMESFGFASGLTLHDHVALVVRTITDECSDKDAAGDTEQQRLMRQSGIPLLIRILEHQLVPVEHPEQEAPPLAAVRILSSVFKRVLRQIRPNWKPAGLSYVNNVDERGDRFWMQGGPGDNLVERFSLSLARHVVGRERMVVAHLDVEQLDLIVDGLATGAAETASASEERFDQRAQWLRESRRRLIRLVEAIDRNLGDELREGGWGNEEESE